MARPELRMTVLASFMSTFTGECDDFRNAFGGGAEDFVGVVGTCGSLGCHTVHAACRYG